VWNPLTDFAEGRTVIVDPLPAASGRVVGLKLSYVSAVGAGGAAFLLPNQWSMLGKLRTIPDTVDEFTGYSIALDLWRGPSATPRNDSKTEAGQRCATSRSCREQPCDGARDGAAGPRCGDPEVDQRIRARHAAPCQRRGKPGVGRRCLVQRQEALVLEAQRLIRVTRAAPRPAVTGKLE
jgi:hypothetical protein